MIEALNTPGLTGPDEIIAAMKQSIQSFANGAEQADDLTMLCLLYRGPGTDQRAETAAEAGEAGGKGGPDPANRAPVNNNDEWRNLL